MFLSSQCDSVRVGETLGGNQVKRSGTLMNGISALIKGSPELSFLVPLCEDTTRIWYSVTRQRAITRIQLCWHPDLPFQHAEL